MKAISLFIILSIAISLAICSKGIHVEGNKLLAANDKEFIFRGVNLAHAWYTDKTQFSLGEISSLGANSARIVLACGSQWTKTPKSEVENIVNWCENEGLICVLELHDFTGSNKAADITEKAVNYWDEMKDVLNAHKDYIIINIANEWTAMIALNKEKLWRETYITAVKSMREKGIENAIMIDASGYGQETGVVTKNAKTVLEADPDKNIIFSLHVYDSIGKSESSLISGFDGLKETGVCWVVGEFGWKHSGIKVAYQALMDYCQENGIGWIAWSWAGNSGGDECLDLTSAETFSRNDLTDWGNNVFYGDNGIKSTSKKAYDRK